MLVHGRGANEHDLLGLLRRARPRAAPARLLARAGRCRCRPAERTGTRCRGSAIPTRRRSPRASRRWRGSSTRCPTSAIVIGGFSQGAVMSLAVGLGESPPTPRGGDRVLGLPPDRGRLAARHRGAVPADRGRARHLRPDHPRRVRPPLARAAPGRRSRGPLPRVADRARDRPGRDRGARPWLRAAVAA